MNFRYVTLYCYFTTDASALIITELVPSKLNTRLGNKNGYTEELLAETADREQVSDEDEYELGGEYEEAMDQLRALPNQLLAGKPVRAPGRRVIVHVL